LSEKSGHIEKIEAYLENRLSGEELKNFKDQMSVDKALKQEVEIQEMAMLAIEDIGRQDLENELQSIHEDLFFKGSTNTGNNLKYALIGSGILSIAILALFINNKVSTSKVDPNTAKIEQVPVMKEEAAGNDNIKLEDDVSSKFTQKEQETANLNNTSYEKTSKIDKLEEGEIIFNFHKDGIPEPELVLSDTIGQAYLFNGKQLRFYNINPDKIQGVTYMEIEELLYLVYNDKCFRLELNRKPQNLIKEKDKDIIRYLMMD